MRNIESISSKLKPDQLINNKHHLKVISAVNRNPTGCQSNKAEHISLVNATCKITPEVKSVTQIKTRSCKQLIAALL